MLKGTGVSSGIGFGRTIILRNEKRIIEKKIVENEELEIQRLKEAVKDTIRETKGFAKTIKGTEREIIEAYLMIMQDQSLINEAENTIKKLKCNAEYAIEVELNKLIQVFENMSDEYLSSRARDISDIKNKILSKLLKEETGKATKLAENTIIIAEELTTSDIVKLDIEKISGIITEIGSTNSHSSIIAKAHNIPAITKVENATKIFENNAYIAIDGKKGEIYLEPSQEEKERLLRCKENIKKKHRELEIYKDLETKTKDGYKVKLFSNIGLPTDVKDAVKNTAEGIGLFRSELLYMNSKEIPTEEYQYNIYKKIAEKMQGKTVIIRTLDIGGDKRIEYLKIENELNPFLGQRGIRFCLENLNIFKMQLRAILKASVYGNLSIMLPMISSIEELRKAKEILEECKKELDEEKEKYEKDIKVGIMIEIPSAALIAYQLACECDFFSIGTNDLIQYTIAIDRENEKISSLYTKYHPAVLRLIKEVIDGAHKANINCGMCGEIAGDKLLIPVLVGLGLEEFSVNPNSILKTRKIINNLKKTKCKRLAKEILDLGSAQDVEIKLKEFMEGI